MESMEKIENEIPFSEKNEFNCTECCKDCQAFECPYNETMCQ